MIIPIFLFFLRRRRRRRLRLFLLSARRFFLLFLRLYYYVYSSHPYIIICRTRTPIFPTTAILVGRALARTLHGLFLPSLR